MCVCMYHSMHMAVRGNLTGVGSLLLPCRSPKLNLGHQAWYSAFLHPGSTSVHYNPIWLQFNFLIAIKTTFLGRGKLQKLVHAKVLD